MNYSKLEILEALWEEIDRREVDRRNDRDFLSFYGSSEGLEIFTLDQSETFDEMVEAGYSAREAARAVAAEKRKKGFT